MIGSLGTNALHARACHAGAGGHPRAGVTRSRKVGWGEPANPNIVNDDLRWGSRARRFGAKDIEPRAALGFATLTPAYVAILLRRGALIALLCCGVARAEQPLDDEMPGRGEMLFSQKCGICHLEGKTGAQMLERRLGKDLALLHKRNDLAGAYIGTVVRQGLAGMPPLTRVELPDAELDSIVRYLTRSGPSASGTGHE